MAYSKGRHVDEVETGCGLGLLAPSPGMKILDAGCGTENLNLMLARMECSVTGGRLRRGGGQ